MLAENGKDQSVDSANLAEALTQVKEKVKTKACDVVLKQPKSFIDLAAMHPGYVSVFLLLPQNPVTS